MIRLTTPSISNEEYSAIEDVLKSGFLVHDKECDLFEKELAKYLGCDDVIVVSSCTAALHMSLIALGIGQGDAVIVPDFTFAATANVVELTGADVVPVDVVKNTYNIDCNKLKDIVEKWNGKKKLKAIIPVHEFGCPADMTSIMQIAKTYDLLVIEDAACALGTVYDGKKVGTFGDLGCFSFHPRKALTTGEGGAITVNDKDLAKHLRLLRNHGMEDTPDGKDFVMPGYNYRMTNFQAAMGRTQLKKFDDWVEIRIKLQKEYRNELSGLKISLPLEVPGHTWQSFMIVLPVEVNRKQLIEKMNEKNIQTGPGAQAIHCLKYYREKYNFNSENLKNAEMIYKHGLILPFSQSINKEQISFIVQKLNECM